MFDERDRKYFYDEFKNNGYEVGSYDDFKKDLNNKEDRDWYYNEAKNMGYDVGTQADFDKMVLEPAPSTSGGGKQVDSSATTQSVEQKASTETKPQVAQPAKKQETIDKEPGLIAKVLDMIPTGVQTSNGTYQPSPAISQPVVKGEEMPVKEEASSSSSANTAPVTTPTGVVNNEGLMDAKLANYIENWKQRPDKEGDYFANMVADLLADGTANSNEEAVNMVMPALYRYANRSAMDVTNQVVSSLPDDTVQDAEQSIDAQWYSHGVQDKLNQEADSMGISYDDYVAHFLKPAMVQSLVNKYGPNYRNIAEGIATRLYAHDEHVQDRLMNQDINDALSNVINKYVNPSVVDEYNKAQEAGSKAFTEGMEGSQFIPANLRLGTALGAQYEANEAKDPAKVLSGLQKKFGKLYRNPKFLNDMSNAAFKVMQRYGLNGTQSSDPKQFKPMINSVLKNELDQLEIKGMMPKGSAEYIMKTGLGNTIVGKITRKAVQTDYQNWLEDIANQQYQPGFWENVASGALTFAGDAWSYWLPGAAGGKLTKSMVAKAEGKLAGDLMAKGMERKMAERAAKVLIGKSKAAALKSGSAHGAVTFGGQSAISKPIDEVYRTGQFDENGKIYNPSVGKVIANTLGEVAKQSAVGAIMQGGTIANMIGKGRGLATNILADVGGKVVDSGIMTGQQMLERMAQDPNFKPTGKEAVETFLESGANLLSIGFPGFVGKYARFKDAREFNKKFDFTDQDIAELKRFGYDGLRDAFEKVGIGEYAVVGENAQRLDGQLTQKYMDLMNDKSVPEVLKAKMMAVVEGKRPSSFSPVIDSEVYRGDDGKYYLETYNKDGGVIDRKEYSSHDAARNDEKKLEYEKTLGLASVLEGEFHNEFTQEHLEGLYNKAAQKYNMGEKLTDEDKAAVYLHQNAGVIKEIMDKQQKGIILTDEEQKQINAYRHYYDSALENSSVMREFVNTFEDSNSVARGTLRKALESKDKKYAPLVESYLKELYNSIELKREMKQTMDDLYNTSHGNEQKRIEGESPVSPVEGSSESSAGGQESPVSEGPAPYQDRTNSVSTPSDAEFAANPANLANENQSESKASDAFVMGQNAYKNGDKEGLKSIKYNAETAELRLKRAFANDTDRIQGVYNAVNKGTDIETYIEQRTNYLTPFQQEAIRKYAEAMDANKGAMDALEHADDGYADKLKQQLSQYTMENGNISSLTLTDGQRGYWKSKNEYGAGFGVFPDANGQPVVKQVPSSQVKENGKEIPLQEYVNQLATQKHEATKKDFNAIFDATSLKPNDTVSLSINDKDQPTEAKIVSVNPDGTISFNIAGSKNVTTVPVDTFTKFQKYALRNSINAELDAEDAERAEKEAIKVEAEKKQRFANGIVGLREQKPDYSSKETDHKVAAEYLQEQYADNHDQLIKLVNGSRSDIKEQIDNIRKRIVEAEDWLDTNADLEPEQVQLREDKLKLAKEQLEDLTTRYDNWNKIRSLIMTEEEKRELKDKRTANMKKVGIDKEALTVTDEREVPVLTDEELKKQYPTMDEASDYILSQRKEISKTQKELHRLLQDIDARLNQYLLGESDLTDEEIRDFNTTKADLEARMANLSASAKDLIAQNDSLKKLYKLENQKAREEALKDMSPAEQRRVKAEQYLNDRNISGLTKLYADTSVDFMDDHPYTVDEYVASSIGRHALNYEGREVNGTFLNGLQQEFGGTRKDLEKIQVLAAEGKGQTFDKYVNDLYNNLPDNLRNQGVNTQEIRNSLLALLRGAEKYSDLKNYILKEKIAHAEEEMRSMDLAEEEQRAAYEEVMKENTSVQDNQIVNDGDGGTDNMGNQLNSDGSIYTEAVKSLDNIKDEEFEVPTRSVELPSIPQNVNDAIGANGKPVIIKKNIFEKNATNHPELDAADSRAILSNALYNPNIVGQTQPVKRPSYKVAVQTGDKNSIVVLDVYNDKKQVEIVGWRLINEKGLAKMQRQAEREGGQFLILSPNDGSAAALSALPLDLSSGGKDTNNSDNLQEKGTKFSEKLQNAIAETETEPTEAQKKAGNYKKGHLSFGGYDFTVETPKGVTRSGKDEQGKPWSVTMHDTYGYILGKIGVDGDHIDMFINDAADLDTFDGNVYVVDQVNPETGEFDEHKVMYGYPDEAAATKAYLSNYSKGWKGLGKVTSVPKVTFDKWLESSDRKTKPFREYAMIQHEEAKKAKQANEALPFDAPMSMDDLPFHRDVKEVKPENLTEAQKVAYDAVSTMLKKAGIPVKVVSNEDMEKVAEAQDNLNLAMLLNQPEMRFKIKTPEEKKAAENAYNFAKELRPDKWKQYAVVDMSNPNMMPEYFEKQELARKERSYYNKLMWGNYKVFNLDKSFEDNVAGLTGSFPSEFDPYKIDEQTNKRNELKKQIKETEDAYNSTGQERNNYQIQLMKEYMDEHGLDSENDIPDDVWNDCRNKSFEKYQDKLDSLFAKYKDLDRQLKAIAEPGVRFLRTYHGTGASFSEFDFDHIGEGEGSQAFGWGGYVTSSKKIGKNYATLMDNDPSRAYYRIQHSNGTRFAKKYPTLESFLHGDKQIAMNDKFTEQEKIDFYNEMKKLAEPYHNLYEVDIPEDNGSNYLDWDASIPSSINKDNIIKDILDNIQKQEDEKEDWELESLENDINDSLEWANNGEELYKAISLYLGDKTASKLLASLGYTGIKYKAGRNFGGAEKGDTNYVIFNPKDMKIVDHTKFAQGKGVVYGYTDGKEIVLNQEHLNPNTPIHEYQHLWRTAAKEMNPDLIAHGDELIKQTQLFADLKEDPNYKHLSDDEICDEAFARLTGEDGASILEQMAKDAIKENPLDTAKELTIINRLKNWLKQFWYWTLDTFTKWKPEDIKRMTLEDIRNLVLRDLAQGVDPRNVKSRMTKDEAVSLRKQMADNAEQERILEHTEENWLKEFGKNSRVTTPIGSIKLGENQYKKAGRNDRIKRFGLLKPTLERPDVILEKSAPKEGAERQTKYLFIKSFKKADGNKILNYESITVKQGEEEVAISAHQIDPSKVVKELTESKVLWNRFRGDSNSLGENQGSALTPSANNPSGKDSVLNPHSDAKIRNNIETAKGNGGNLSVEDKIKAVSRQFGVDEADVAMYANAIKKGSTAEAARARANIKRHLLQANEDKISSLKELLKYTKPVNEALKENFGDVDAMIEERVKQVEAQRNAMEAARKRAEEEEAKRQKHLEELSLIPDDKLDKQYMDALAKGDDATAREMLDEAARRKGYDDTESSYQGVGAWAAPGNPGYESDKARRDDWESSGSDVNLEDIALGYAPQPDDYFSHPERYSQNTPHGLESVKAINTAIDAIKNGEKDVKVKVYRAVPTSVKEGKLRNGDWVTPSKKYADIHGNNRLEGKYRIIEDEVPANQLWWDGNDANEFGFDDGKEYKYKNAKNNRKLNDLVTYDDKGDVIPPSKRFNSRKSDIRFMFGGEMGAAEADKAEEKTYRMDNLKVAEEMERGKKDAKAIKLATGWERGADGRWRYEMPDAKIKDMKDIGGGNIVKRFDDDMLWNDGKLTDVIDAPGLFEAYPQLKDVRIDTDAIMNDMPSNGVYNAKTNTITIHADDLKYMNSILNHEIQHAIQYIEGFAKGGSPEQMEKEFKEAQDEWKARAYAHELEEKAKEMGGEYNQSEVEKALVEEYKDLDMSDELPDKETRIKGFNYFARGYADRSMDDAIKRFRLNESTRSDFDSYKEYLKLAGEVESRNVEKRLGMTDEERRNSLAEETEDVNRDEQIVMNGNDASYSIVKDPETIKKLDKEDTVKVYRAMQIGEDGKLYPPMAAKVKGKFVQPIELGKWEQADERPELADDKGMFTLNKGNGKSLKAAYNPYLHTSRTPLNDQFSEAQNRPNIVTVEVEVPKSELTSGYKADKAKDAVGEVEWKAGIIQGQLTGKRKVVLSRWDKPVRIVPDSEVADVIVNDMFKGKNITMPSNVVTPSLRKELEKRGVPFVETDNRGRIVGGENDGVHYSKVYGKKANVKPRLGSATIGLKAAKDKVVELFNKAKSGEFNGKPQSIGTLTQEGKKFLEDLSGLKMKDKIDFVLNPSDLKHMNKDHFGNNEKDPGRNIPLTEEDLRSMVDVIMNPEQVVYGIEKMDNRKAFFFLKQAEDGTLNLAEIYSDKKGNLTAKSYYKTKKGVDQRVMEIKNSLLPTPEASSGSPLSDGKGINFFSIEQEKTAENAENERKIADSVVNTANKLGGAEATVYSSLDDVPEEYRSEVEQGAKGWYDPETHTVHVYLPNCEDGNDAQRTVFHEKIGHEGMEVLLGGEDGVRKFANFFYRSVGKDIRGKIIDFANKYDPDWKNPDRMNVGTQEYIAHLAEEGPKTAEDFSLWTKIKHYLIKVLKKLGVRVPGLLNDKDLRYYLMKAGKALHVWDEMPQEKQEAMMKQASNAEIKDALSDGAGKGKPRQKKGESAIQFIKRVREWERWKEAREDENDPEPPMFYDFDKDAEGKKEWERLNKEWRDSHHLQGDEMPIKPERKEGETDEAFFSRYKEWEKWNDAMADKENPMPDMFDFEKKKQEEVKRKYEDWLAKHDLLEQQQADLDLYEGKIYPAETNPKADALEQQVMQDLAEVTSTDVSKEGAAKTVKHAVIHRRKNMEEASADDAIYINDVKNRIEKMADSGAFDKLLSDYKGKPNRAEKLAEAIPYIIEAPRRLRDLAHDLNATGAFDKGHIHIQPTDVEAIQPFVADLIAETGKMHTVLKDDKEVKVYDDPQAVSDVASKMAQAINANHQGEEGFVPIDGTDILSKHVLPLVKQQIVPKGIDYKNLSPEMKATLDSIRDWYNYTYDWLKDNHTLREDTGYNADYVNHIWDKEKSDKQAYAMYVENRQRTKSPNEKPRTISTLMEGISVGLVPKTTDITKMMAYYSRSNIEAWVNKTMLQELSGLNVIKRNEDGEIISSDPLLSSSTPFNLEQYKDFVIPGVGLVWVYNVSPKQVTVKNPITGKENVLYREASAGDIFGVVFETYQSSPFWNAFDTLASSAKKLELGFSGFHAGALTEVYMVQNMAEFGPKKAMANFMKYIFVDTIKNHQLPCFANPEDFQEAASHLVKFGATNDYAAADVQNMFDNLRDFAQKLQKKLEERGNIGTAAGAATIPFEIATQMVSMLNKGMDVALWDFIHDGLKLASYRMRADRTKERAKKYGWTDEQLSKALDEDGQFVNDMFGGQHWDILGVSQRTFKIAGRVLLSPDWNVSTTRHFMAMTGFGSVYSEATLEDFKNYYNHVWAAARGKEPIPPEYFGRKQRQISALICYFIGFLFYEAFANGTNAAFCAMDEEKERKKAEEIRKTNPSYKSMYELAYPDGMKWYDYLMRGNSLGQQSKIFLGRYADGTEMYIRHGKQFREVPEYFFNEKGDFEIPGPFVNRLVGKANPLIRMGLDDYNYLSPYRASHSDKELQRKYGKLVGNESLGKTIGLLHKNALYWAPFLIPSQENKEFKAVDFFFPSSKGFSPWKAQSYFKDFILSGDMEGVVMTYQSCQRNGIDAEAQIKAAIGSVKALESAEMQDGVTSLQEASKRFDAAKSITEKKKMRQKMKKFLSQSDYKAFTQKEALDMVQGYLNGDEDLKEMEKAESKYLMKAKAEDVTEDWRIQNVWNGTMETYQEYKRLKDVDKAKANAFKNSKTNKRLFAARKAISAARRKMNKAKKQMDGTNDAAKLVEIRNTRKELLEKLNGME